MLYFSTYFFKLNNKSGRLLEGGRLLVLSPYHNFRFLIIIADRAEVSDGGAADLFGPVGRIRRDPGRTMVTTGHQQRMDTPGKSKGHANSN